MLYLNVTDGRTDDLLWQYRALRSIARYQNGLKCDVVSAVFCDSLMDFAHATTASNSSEIVRTANGYPYMTTAVYWCLDGRKFDDGTKIRTLHCVGNGYWSFSSVECACMFCDTVSFPGLYP